MRIIICGAGQVGYSIASYLAREDADVTVIDKNPDIIAQVNDGLDVNGIVGHASKPDTLSQAGAADADIILAVTHSDEVNMVACQVAHSLFNVPKKIARVREQSYLEPAWSNLFSRAHMPIDVIISPEKEVAKGIFQRLSIPGTSNVVSLADDKIKLVGVVCDEKCPVTYTQFKQIHSLFPGLHMEIGAIIRGAETIIPDKNDQIIEGDEVYFFTDNDHLQRAMTAFGHQERKARHITIMGGGNIGLFLTEMLQKDYKNVQLKILEHSEERAIFLSEHLSDVIVINGDALQNDIMKEANIAQTETLIAITNDDETNIIGSLMAKNMGCERAMTLINKTDYSPLIMPLGIDATISPRIITVSSIMRHVRRGRIKELHNVCNGSAEVMQIEVADNAAVANKIIADIKWPKNVALGAVMRNDELISMHKEQTIKPGDHVILLMKSGMSRKVEKLFMPEMNLF
jgi:trk system potassium uptake protein TrkA